MNEEWMNMINYETFYQVSNLGNIRSLNRVSNKGIHYKGKNLKLSINGFGYLRFNACNGDTTKTIHVHRIVMLTFKPIDKILQVNHIDGDKLNNNINNLEWCTDSENKKHAYKTGLMIGGNEYSKTKKDLKRYEFKSIK